MLGVWEPNWDLLESILALRGELRLLSLKIGLLNLIVGHWESIVDVCGSIVGLLESILGLYDSFSLPLGGRVWVSKESISGFWKQFAPPDVGGG